MNANEVPAPPAGFRKAIPCAAKLASVIRQEGKCKTCGESLEFVDQTQFDHVPALQLRGWDAEEQDTIPPANDPEAIHAKHKVCHLVKTTGRKGESNKNAVHGDVAEIARLKRLTKQTKEFRDRILASDQGLIPEGQDKGKKKTRWPKRSFNREASCETKHQGSGSRIRSSGSQREDRRILFRDRIKENKTPLPPRRSLVSSIDRENSENGVPE